MDLIVFYLNYSSQE